MLLSDSILTPLRAGRTMPPVSMALIHGLALHHVALVLGVALLLFGTRLPPGGMSFEGGRGPVKRRGRAQRHRWHDRRPKEGE
jgi:hypothetical protein